ncbi:MAG: hypothetical protein IK073_04095 [Paludibacteraceae bacterium]|nr:hypothetical protein [Paludibacteraceae bacterium]
MKIHYRILLSLLLLGMAVTGYAANGYIDTLRYQVCAGDTLTITLINPSHELRVYNDTAWTDTIHVGDPTADSIHLYVVNILPRYEWTEYKRIHPGDSLAWHDTVLYQAGTYERFFRSVNGCDSIYRIHLGLTQDETGYHFLETWTICESEDFSWRGRSRLNKTGIGQTTHYYDRFRTAAGQDSIYELMLTVLPVVRTTRTIPFCGSIEWNGETITKTTVLVDTLTSLRYNCDSIITTTLAKGIPFHHHDTVSIHPGETVTWRGQTITHDGQYEDRYTSTYGCDSIYTLGVGLLAEVAVTPMRTLYESTCEGEGFAWRNKIYYNAGRFTDTVFVNNDPMQGIDSLYVLVLTVHPTYTQTERMSFHNYPVNYRGAVISGPMDTTFRYMTVNGCDSLITVHFDREVIHDEYAVTICYGEAYDWYGTLCKETNRYVYIEQDAQGRDSVEHVLNLQVITLPDRYMTHTMCKGSTFTFYDRLLTEAGEYTYDSYEQGCKQTIHLSLNVLHPDTVTDIAHINEGGQYTWPRTGQTFKETGVYYNFSTNHMGCDSVEVLILTINHVDTIDSTAVICAGETLEWHGIKASQTGDYSRADLSASGNYNFYRLHLTVREQVPDFIRHLYACGNGATITYNGEQFDHDTVVISHFASVNGCDSVEKVYMHFDVSNFYSDTIVITDQQLPYTWTYQLAGLRPDTVLTNAGTFHHRSQGEGTCYNFEELVLIIRPTYLVEERVTVCESDLPYYWLHGPASQQSVGLSHQPGTTQKYEYRESSVYGTDSIFRLYLSIAEVYDTTIYLHGCQNKGVVWHDRKYERDTAFVAHVPVVPYNPKSPCDSIFHVNIILDTVYTVRWDTTLCEYQLPLIVGRVNPDTIWWEGNFRHTSDATVCGCDSTIEGHLTIIPSLERSDSTFICSDDIQQNPVVLGNLTHPAFLDNDPGRWDGKWEGKWRGVAYSEDTIVWDCDHRYFHHIFVRPSQRVVPEKTYYLCPDDSIQIFWPHDTTWFCHDTTYYERRPMVSAWTDTKHGNRFYDDSLTCDSLTRWHIKVLPRRDTESTRHILLGDSLLWGGIWRFHTGDYDSVMLAPDTNSLGDTCRYVHTLHLIVDTAYLLRDTITLCERSAITVTHTWADGHITQFNTTDEDSTFHVVHTLRSHSILGLDSIYDLYVDYHKIRETVLHDTLCGGDSLAFDRHWFSQNNNQTHLQYLYEPGIYRDTVTAANGCDSIVTLHLYVRDVIPVHHQTVHIPDTKAPYVWTHRWTDLNGQTVDSVRLLTASGDYYCTMRSIHGCDSIDHLALYIHPTYHITDDTIDICQNETPYTWRDKDNITQTGDYVLNALTTAGYDSIMTVHINVWPQLYTELFYEGCQGDSVKVNGKTYSLPGVYRDTLLTRHGCDSVLTIHYDWHNTYLIQKTAQTDDQTPYRWLEGNIEKILTYSGVYYDTLQTVDGCDSIIQLTLTVYPTYRYEENQIICASETPYEWRGHQFWTTGTYYDTLQTVQHYDSLYVLRLTVRDTTYIDKFFTICHGESFVYNNRSYSRGGVYLDTLKSSYGCDSIIVIRVQELPHYLFSDTVAISNRQPYQWRNRELLHSGIYADTLQTALGCDSVYQLVLTVYDKEVLRDTVIRACDTDLPVRWRNRWLNQAGIIYDTITTHDIDTIWRIDLRVIPMEYEVIEQTLCEGESYYFNGRTFTRDTLLHDTVYTGLGCGREYTVFLRFRKTQVIDIDAKTPSGKPYIWTIDGTTYSYGYTGAYEHVVRTKDDTCDSIRYVLHLTVGPVYDYRDSIRLCESELPYIWHNQFIYHTGTYYDSLQTVMGYDSVYTLKVLQIMPSYYGEQTIDLCSGSSAFYYRGKAYSQAGIFYDTIPSISGCDSVFRITVRVLPTYEIYDTVHISDKETYLFDGRILDVPGPYVAYRKTMSGCDSILHLQLFVHPSYLMSEEQEICDNETFVWRGRPLNEAGYYYDSLLTTQGYDSVYKLHLIVHPTYYFQESVEVCPNRTTYLHGINISQPGIYLDTLYTIHGCDSVYKITVNWTRSFRQEFSDTICSGESYNFFGVNYTRSGTYRYEIGCDSVIILHLLVRPKDIVEKRVVISDEELPYRYQGREYWHTDIYVDSMTNRYGCDSLFKLNLIVSEHVSPWYQIPLCPGSEIRIDSMVITRSGTYTFLRRSKVSGLMDSLYRVEIYDAPAYDLPLETRRICMGDTLYYGGQALTRGGHYDFYLKTADGCDSIMHLDLTVNPTYQFYTDATITDYQSYLWRGSEYNTTGEYNQTLPTVNDCDSTYTLRLTVIPTERRFTEDTICQGDKYIWRGDTLRTEGYYSDTVWVPGSHNSAIYALHLVVVKPTRLEQASIGAICADDQQLEIRYTYTGSEPVRYSIVFDQLAKDQGFLDVINIPFTGDMIARAAIPQQSEVVYLEHTSYIRPDYYTLRLVFDNGICPASYMDSVQFLVRYPAWIIEQNWDDVIAPLRPELNGQYRFAQYDWYVNDVRQPNNGLGYLHNNELQVGDQVVLYATREGESYAIPTCPLTIQPMPVPVNPHPTLVYPSQTPRYMPVVTIQSEQSGQYSVYSSTGTLIETGTFEPGEQQLTLPAVNGLWLIRTQTESEPGETHKVVVY